MDLDWLPLQLREVLNALAGAIRTREPAIRAKVEAIRAANPGFDNDRLAQKLIRDTRIRVAATGAASGAAAIAPGLGTLLALGAATSQALYALEQETELVLAIAMIYGHELSESDERVLEALVVVGIAGGSVKLRENVLVAGGERITVAAFRALPKEWLSRAGGHVVGRILARVAGSRVLSTLGRVAPLAIGMAVGAGFDWIAVGALGRAAIGYYGPGGPAARAPRLASENGRNVELGN
ncbi:MAG TPA: hypothetical protein VNG93_14530 [Candidatus Dormibacteraeota bacterium]|nr:hypothetical protein [Candidatus Dormibacteraeota bacterium]